jgi:hypothetical protein
VLVGHSESTDYVNLTKSGFNSFEFQKKASFAYALDLKGHWKWGVQFLIDNEPVNIISSAHLDHYNHIEMMGIMSSDDGREPITILMKVNAKTGQIMRTHKLSNIRTAPIIQHMGMTHEIKDNWKDEGESPTHWYAAFIIIDYNGKDENQVSDTVFKLLLMKLQT